ncbi:FxLYD domain-containing protein [Paenibacillus alkaliterrae]|uniref:FxLYD domain-containing protein n=1 Tax=Paenibacillus alkaliterrae TaxID=320909 RepID=UPI001F26895D|nr:FxLYD domain-containing protein [Paenibacillus alkaliterrae]MCF2941137.1 FxLYD domain-containing protein [Paenibacillus alkaliterrae]
MYCHHCGKKRTDDAIYCMKCGRLLAAEEEADENAGAEQAAGLSESDLLIEAENRNGHQIMPKVMGKREASRSVWPWLTPLLLAVVMAVSLFFYYTYQSHLNDRVLELQAEGKAAAMAGHYAEALDKLNDAADARPAFAAVQADIEIVTDVAELERMVAAAGKQLENQLLGEAEQALEQARERLKGRAEPVYAKVKDQMETCQVKLDVMKLAVELEGLTTVDELEAKLKVAKGLDSEEAAAVQEQIIARIIDISYTEAEALLQKKDYTDALSVTVRALAFAKDNERLTSLEKRIQQAQEQYEKMEQQRLEQAMQKAAEEDLKNQTAAVEVVNIVTTLDEFGALHIEAELKNAATRPIYSISIEFTVYDAEGNEVGSGTAEAMPNYVEPGETMSFMDTVFGVFAEDTTVVVDHATWYLD